MNKSGKPAHKSQQGFTLVELMVALVVAMILSAAVYGVYKVQVRTSTAQDQVTEMQQNIRAAYLMLTRDLRMAGFDPNKSGKAGITTATETQFRFTQDLWDTLGTGESDGKIDGPREDADYRLNGDEIGVQYGGAGGYQPIAENIQQIQFFYKLKDDTRTLAPTAAQLKEIETITVSILARAGQPDFNYTDTKTYILGDGNPIAGPNPPNDNFRRRLFISEVACRNI